jgi:hypothetical protein
MNKSINEIVKEIVTNNGQTIDEIVFDLWLENSKAEVYLNIADALETQGNNKLALKFLTESFKHVYMYSSPELQL